VIEKHLTFPERGQELDDPIALTPERFGQMCRELGEYSPEQPEGLRERAEELYGRERVQTVLGSGRKELAQAERPFYRGTNRSLVALRDLPPGERLSEENCALLRAEQNRPAGLRPAEWPLVRKARLAHGVSAGEGISWSHLLRSD
jgi:sialic acid synthase SpsE